MSEAISRREFLRTCYSKFQRPLRILGQLIVFVAIAWLIYVTFHAAQGISLHGWAFIACMIAVATLFWTARYFGTRWHSQLTTRGKAVCFAIGEIIHSMVCILIGVLAWWQYQAGNRLEFGIIVMMLVWMIITRAVKNYRRNIGREEA